MLELLSLFLSRDLRLGHGFVISQAGSRWAYNLDGLCGISREVLPARPAGFPSERGTHKVPGTMIGRGASFAARTFRIVRIDADRRRCLSVAIVEARVPAAWVPPVATCLLIEGPVPPHPRSEAIDRPAMDTPADLAI
jgi:hypothetical protein